MNYGKIVKNYIQVLFYYGGSMLSSHDLYIDNNNKVCLTRDIMIKTWISPTKADINHTQLPQSTTTSKQVYTSASYLDFVTRHTYNIKGFSTILLLFKRLRDIHIF